VGSIKVFWNGLRLYGFQKKSAKDDTKAVQQAGKVYARMRLKAAPCLDKKSPHQR